MRGMELHAIVFFSLRCFFVTLLRMACHKFRSLWVLGKGTLVWTWDLVALVKLQNPHGIEVF